MKKQESVRWLKWARELQSISQTGLAFCEDRYNRDRYTRLAEIASEIVAEHTSLNPDRLLKNFLDQPGYATPKVDVRGAIAQEGRILLVQERSDEKWCLPGGWADVGETPSEMVIREVWEESGFQVKATKLVGVWDANRAGVPLVFYHAYKIIFLCEVIGGTARESDETMGVDYFDFDDLPPLSEQRTHTRHLEEVRRHFADPLRTSYFE